MNRIAQLIAGGYALAVSTSAVAAISDPVRIDSGLVSGTSGMSADVRVFKGLPFAAPPVGPLRWRAPQPVAKWDGIRKADAFGSRCMQGGGGGGRGNATPTSEDCLYLNVWTAAASTSERRSVIVWSYGGSLTSGSGSQLQYDGEALAKKGVIFVTYNYRLGVFGFFAHPELTRESVHNASGNQGLLDLTATLQWVQNNITSFGGDPSRVTIMGESAGASLVGCLVGSPIAKGLFHRAIAESASCGGTRIAPIQTLAQGEEAGKAVAAKLNALTLAELRELPADELLKKGTGTRVIIDGWSIPEDVPTMFAHGRQNAVDLLVGSNKDEGTFGGFGLPSGDAQGFIQQSRQSYAAKADAFLKLYPAGSDAESNASQLAAFRDKVAWNMRTWARQQSSLRTPRVYVYYFIREPPVGPGQPNRGASHTAEIPYAFNNLYLDRNRPWTDADRTLADIMSSYWANFAATGDPNRAGLPVWPLYKDKTPDSVMVLDEKVRAGSDPDPARLAFYDAASK
jgi:para-nitrobenzyl esterase